MGPSGSGRSPLLHCLAGLDTLTSGRVVVADEPTGNLDSRAFAELLGMLRRAVRELGRTVVMVTHDPVAASSADRVVFRADGRVAGELGEPTAEGSWRR